MRITNKMMTNNMLYNINGNKKNMSSLEQKYSTGLKIQRPSDDPIVAVRALKLRTNLSELTQYFEKNIPDAKSWMETTESALRTTSAIITQIHTYCVQGANDTLTEADRKSISENLLELKQQIYQEGNSNYAGRYLFTGYKTDTPLVFDTDEFNLNYKITERISADAIEISDRVVDTMNLKEFSLDDVDAFDTDTRPGMKTIYRLRLAYNNLKTIENGGSFSLKIPEVDENGEIVYDDDGEMNYTDELTESDMNVMNSDNPLAYKPEDDEINYLEDTGELIFGKSVYDKWRKSNFEITYEKNSFLKNELRPEHYFDCVSTDLTIEDDELREAAAIEYTAQDQQICYEVNFNQRLKINVQGREAFSHALGRTVDDIVKSIADVEACRDSMAKVDKMLLETDLSDEQRAKLEVMKDVLKTELDLKDSMMRQAYERGLTSTFNEEDRVNVATADIGTRYNRLELTEDRLSTQQTEFTDLLSQNEDADIVDTIVQFNAAETIYNASLSSASKVVKNTLLDFL